MRDVLDAATVPAISTDAVEDILMYQEGKVCYRYQRYVIALPTIFCSCS